MEPLMTIDEIVALLCVPESWVYARTCPKCAPAERSPHAKLGRHLRFDGQKVLAWLAEHERDGHEKSGLEPEGDR